MSKEKRLQRKLDRMGKKSGNTASVEDGKQEVNEFIEDNGTKGQKPSVTGQNLLKDMKTNYKARFGGGRAAAALDSGRGGVSKSLTSKKLIPNT